MKKMCSIIMITQDIISNLFQIFFSKAKYVCLSSCSNFTLDRQMISIHYSPFATQYGQNIINCGDRLECPRAHLPVFIKQIGPQQPHLVKVFGQQWCKLGTPPLDKSCHANRCEWPKTRQICVVVLCSSEHTASKTCLM